MAQDNSLIFFGYEDFEWEFAEDPKRPLGVWIGRACREAVPPFYDFTATITVHPRRDYPDSKLKFGMDCQWWLDDGNNSFASIVWPLYSENGQPADAELEDAMQWAYDTMRREYSALEYHLMP